MDLSKLIEKQVAMDDAHGFPVHFPAEQEKYVQITKDLVGLFGEIGEFSNLVKKINIKLERPAEYDLDVLQVEGQLREELVDALIYVMRLSAILDMDLQAELLKKMKFNEARYAQLRR